MEQTELSVSGPNFGIVDIAGVKMEVDLRTAKRVENYRVGTSIKVLKEQYGDYKSYPGVIIGFTEFKERPSMDIMYFNGSDVEFVSLHKESKGIEIAPFNKYEFEYQRDDIVYRLDRNVVQAEEALRSAQTKRKVFLDNFGALLFGEKKAVE